MPIYEFYCQACHMIFNFFSRSINTEKRPLCPKCGKLQLDRQMSIFSMGSKNVEGDAEKPMPDLDESKMEQAMNLLAKEADHMDENDPKQAADLMRKLTDMTGLNLGESMEEALQRMEAGEDPEQIEAEMGDLLEGEEPFSLKENSSKSLKSRPPQKDEKLYEL